MLIVMVNTLGTQLYLKIRSSSHGYLVHSQIGQQIVVLVIRGPASLKTAVIYMKAHEQTAMFT